VPCLRAHDSVHALARLPSLEARLRYLDQRVATTVASSDRRHRRIRLERLHSEPAVSEHPRRLPSARADLQHTCPGPKTAKLDQLIDRLGRIRRTRAIVQLGHTTKRKPLLVDAPPRHHSIVHPARRQQTQAACTTTPSDPAALLLLAPRDSAH
jgi:hypothetical protein